MDVALAHAHHARRKRDVKPGRPAHADDELGGAPTDVYDDRRLDRAGTTGHRTEERHPGLFLACEDARIQVALLADLLGECSPVACVAHRGGHHGEVRIAPSGGRSVRVDLLAELRQRAQHPLAALFGERALGVDPRAESRNDRAAHDLNDSAVGPHVGDQQAGGVCAYVDHSRSHLG